MKRIIALLLVGSLLVVVTGCSEGSSDDKPSSPSSDHASHVSHVGHNH